MVNLLTVPMDAKIDRTTSFNIIIRLLCSSKLQPSRCLNSYRSRCPVGSRTSGPQTADDDAFSQCMNV